MIRVLLAVDVAMGHRLDSILVRLSAIERVLYIGTGFWDCTVVIFQGRTVRAYFVLSVIDCHLDLRNLLRNLFQIYVKLFKMAERSTANSFSIVLGLCF